MAPAHVNTTAAKPLASPGLEYRLIGGLDIVAGLALGVAAVVEGQRESAVAEMLSAAAIFATCMYVLALRSVRQAVKQPAATPGVHRERTGDTRRRILSTTTVQLLAIIGFALLTGMLGLAAGIVLGSGVAFLAASRWLRTWELLHDRTVLREPRWPRWSSGKGRSGWGSGLMDPQDFYVQARHEPPPRPGSS